MIVETVEYPKCLPWSNSAINILWVAFEGCPDCSARQPLVPGTSTSLSLRFDGSAWGFNPHPEDAKFHGKEYSTVESGNKVVASRAECVP